MIISIFIPYKTLLFSLITLMLLSHWTSNSHLRNKLHMSKVLDHSRADWYGLNNFFLSHYTTMPSLSNVESFWAYLKDLITQGSKLLYQENKYTQKHDLNDFPPLLNYIHALRKKVKANPTGPNTSALAEAEKTLQEEIEKSKQDFEAGLIRQFEHSNNNKIYKYISSLTNTHGFPDIMTNGTDTATGNPELLTVSMSISIPCSLRMTPNHNNLSLYHPFIQKLSHFQYLMCLILCQLYPGKWNW